MRLLLDERTAAGQLGPDSQHLVDRVETMIAAAPPATVAWAQRAMAARPERLDVLAGVRVPAAVLAGGEDALMPVTEAELMARALPDAELTVLPRVGHLSAIEAPEAFDAVVRRLLERVVAAG